MRQASLLLCALLACETEKPVAGDGGGDNEEGCTSTACADDDGDGVQNSLDCDDADPACSAGCGSFNLDGDGDGHGDSHTAVLACSAPAGRIADGSDCNDDSVEHWSDCGTCVDHDDDDLGQGCDGGDDCDDSADTGAACSTGCVQRYRDADGDGTGAGLQAPRCPGAAGYVANTGDCDDSPGTGGTCTGGCTNAYVDADDDNHGAGPAQGRCSIPANGYAASSDDCDDTPVEGAGCYNTCNVFYSDGDLDGHGDPASATAPRCVAPASWILIGDDCDIQNGNHHDDCLTCDDADLDDRGPGCNLPDDCDLDDSNNWDSCDSCFDYDLDGAYQGCDAYVTVVEDCNDFDPGVHPGAVDFPDTGAAEDCDGLEPHAADGIGLYVDWNAPACVDGGEISGSKEHPFCEVYSAIQAAQPNQSIFVATGFYGLPQQIEDLRIFGGYEGTGWTRNILGNPTYILSSYNVVGLLIGNGVLQGVSFQYSNNCEGCSAINGIGGTTSTLADLAVTYDSSAGSCTSITADQGDLVVLRASISAAGCFEHTAFYVDPDRRMVVWGSDIEAGLAPGDLGIGFQNVGSLTVGDSTVTAKGATARGAMQFDGSSIFVNSTFALEGTNYTYGFYSQNSPVVMESSLVTASASNAYGFWLFGSSLALRNSDVVLAGANSQIAVFLNAPVGAVSTASLVNNVIHGGTSAAGYGINVIDTSGSTVRLLNNSIQGTGTWCPVTNTVGCIPDFDTPSDPAINVFGWAGASETGGNFAADCLIDAEGFIGLGSPCLDAGYDVSAEALSPLDYHGEFRPSGYGAVKWDVGRCEFNEP